MNLEEDLLGHTAHLRSAKRLTHVSLCREQADMNHDFLQMYAVLFSQSISQKTAY